MTHYDKGYLYKCERGNLGRRKPGGQVDKSIFTVRAYEYFNNKIRGYICVSESIYFPESFIGKKIRLKVEVIDDGS